LLKVCFIQNYVLLKVCFIQNYFLLKVCFRHVCFTQGLF
jgi:hypothetical protein